jgi:NTE family protein
MMANKKITVILLILFSVTVYGQHVAKQPMIGLVLSGGGAKGFAHVGVLKVIEEAGIPIDYITGTSIGSIVGGLYAIGYDAETLESVIGNQNWAELLSNGFKREFIPAITKEDQARYLISLPIESKKINMPEGVLTGQNAMDLFTYLSYGYQDSTDFLKFPIPFECIAADIATGEEVVLNKGFLPKAMRASMSVPAVFAGCEINGRMLVDGGIVNNFPVDRCREMGADIIIGVDIGDDLLTKEKIKSIPEMISQLTTLLSFEHNRINSKDANILIKPDISGFSASSFDTEAAKILMKRGEDAARKMLPKLIRLRDSLGLAVTVKNNRELPDEDESFFVSNIEVKGTDKSNILTSLDKSGIGDNKKTTLLLIRQGVSRIYATGNYTNVDYIISGDEKKTITIDVRENSTNKLNVGLHFDTDLKAAALINTTLYSDRISGSNLSLDAKLSSLPMFSARYSLDRGWKPGFATAFYFITDKIIGYDQDTKVSETNVQLTSLQAAVQTIISNTLRVSLGLSYEYFHFGNVIGIVDTAEQQDAKLYNYFVKAKLDNFNNAYFPTAGWALDGTFKLITDNGLSYNSLSPIPYFGLTVKMAKSISERFTILPSFHSQFTFESVPPIFYQSYIGGFQGTNYFGNYLPFAGLRRMELSADNAALVRLDLRMKMWQKVFVSVITNVGIYDNELTPFAGWSVMAGGGLSAAYDSVVGPIELNLCTSNINHSLIAYFSLGYIF